MGLAAVVSLEQFQQERSQADLRTKMHQALDRWLDDIEKDMKEPQPKLEQITEAVFQSRQNLTATITQGLIDSRYQQEQEREFYHCPECRKVLTARDTPARTVETMVGEINLKRPYFYCLSCQKGCYPLDEALDVSSRRKQADLQQAVVKLTKEVPYETACELLEDLTGLTVSVNTAHEITGEIAQGLEVLDVCPSREEILTKIAEARANKSWRPILVIAADGADMPTRPESARRSRSGRKKVRAKRARWKGEWKEAKGFRSYLVLPDRIEHLISWHQIQDYEQLSGALQKVKAAGLIPEEQVRLCILADGAHWIWHHLQTLFPAATEILDYYHCSEYIHAIANTHYAERPELALEWVEATMARLFCGEIESVIWGLQRMQPRDEQAAKEIARTIVYLENNKGRINYGAARKGGYPIGSGGIESANKFICHVRLKRSGAWWYISNGNQMLALRCAKYNGTFDRVCQRSQQLNSKTRKK
jgi:hypothetical protein